MVNNKFLRVLHWIIIANFVLGIAYAAWAVMFLLAPEGSSGGPLFGQAATVNIELMTRRRLYSLEFWIASTGLACYLGITEYLPRILREQRERS